LKQYSSTRVRAMPHPNMRVTHDKRGVMGKIIINGATSMNRLAVLGKNLPQFAVMNKLSVLFSYFGANFFVDLAENFRIRL
jgi:hypothetical protein